MLAQAALARGQWRRAQREVEAARRFDVIPALELWSLFAAFSFLPLPTAEIVSVRRSGSSLGPGGRIARCSRAHHRAQRPAPVSPAPPPGPARHPAGRHHRRARQARALDRASDCIRRRPFRAYPRPKYPGPRVRRWRARPRGARRSGKRRLGDPRPRCSLPRRTTGISGRSCSSGLGREDEALGWYGRSRSGRRTSWCTWRRALRQAEIYEPAGRPRPGGEALPPVHRALENADPELQPVVDGARKRLAETELMRDERRHASRAKRGFARS